MGETTHINRCRISSINSRSVGMRIGCFFGREGFFQRILRETKQSSVAAFSNHGEFWRIFPNVDFPKFYATIFPYIYFVYYFPCILCILMLLFLKGFLFVYKASFILGLELAGQAAPPNVYPPQKIRVS